MMSNIGYEIFILVLLLSAFMIPIFLILRVISDRKRSDISNKELLDLEDSVKELIKKMEQTSQHQIELLDEKLMQIKEAILLAEKKAGDFSEVVNKVENIKNEPVDIPIESLPAKQGQDSSEAQLWKNAVELYSAGFNIQDIAKKLGIMTGEVELIISLNKFQNKPLNLNSLPSHKVKNTN